MVGCECFVKPAPGPWCTHRLACNTYNTACYYYLCCHSFIFVFLWATFCHWSMWAVIEVHLSQMVRVVYVAGVHLSEMVHVVCVVGVHLSKMVHVVCVVGVHLSEMVHVVCVAGVHLSEMARMGVGSKPCLDLKLSKHNINDRFIDISKSKSC